MKNFLTLLLVSLFYCAHAQKAYLVTPQRDTIPGEIQILLPSDYQEEIMLKTDDENKKYKAYQFLSFHTEGNNYRPVKLGNIYKIMRMETPGYLSVLTYRANDNYDFGSKYLLKKSGEGVELPTFLFKKTMTDFLDDCPPLAAKIDDKTYKRSDLDKIVEEYNQCIQRQTKESYTSLSQSKPEINDNNPVDKIIESIKKKLADSSADAQELKTLLADIKTKYVSGVKVPSYMIEALKGQSSDLPNIQEEVNELLELLQ